MHSVRHWLSFFVGAVIFVLGLFPLIGWPAAVAAALQSSLPLAVLMYVLAFGGLYIIVDSFFEFTFHSGVGIGTLLVGLAVFGLGLVSILHSMGAIAFGIDLPAILYYILFMLEGLFLMIACFIMD